MEEKEGNQTKRFVVKFVGYH